MNQFILKSFVRNYKVIIEENKDFNPQSSLKKVLNRKQIDKLEEVFNKYWHLLTENCIDIQTFNLLKEFKKEIKDKFFMDICTEITFNPTFKILKKKSKLMNIELERTLDKLFFYSDFTFAALLGNEEKLENTIKRARSLNSHLAENTQEIYYEIWETIENLREKDYHRVKRRAVLKVAKRHPENLENSESLYKKFMKFMKENEINSKEDFEIWLKLKGYQ